MLDRWELCILDGNAKTPTSNVHHHNDNTSYIKSTFYLFFFFFHHHGIEIVPQRGKEGAIAVVKVEAYKSSTQE